jgi:hypothetical protein
VGKHFFFIFGMDRRGHKGTESHLFQAQKLFKCQEFMIYNELYSNTHLCPHTSQASATTHTVTGKSLPSGTTKGFNILWLVADKYS